jgi:hypothetical protein
MLKWYDKIEPILSQWWDYESREYTRAQIEEMLSLGYTDTQIHDWLATDGLHPLWFLQCMREYAIGQRVTELREQYRQAGYPV